MSYARRGVRLLWQLLKLDELMLWMIIQEMRDVFRRDARKEGMIYKIDWMIDEIGMKNVQLIIQRLNSRSPKNGFSVSLRDKKLYVHFHPINEEPKK